MINEQHAGISGIKLRSNQLGVEQEENEFGVQEAKTKKEKVGVC